MVKVFVKNETITWIFPEIGRSLVYSSHFIFSYLIHLNPFFFPLQKGPLVFQISERRFRLSRWVRFSFEPQINEQERYCFTNLDGNWKEFCRHPKFFICSFSSLESFSFSVEVEQNKPVGFQFQNGDFINTILLHLKGSRCFLSNYFLVVT